MRIRTDQGHRRVTLICGGSYDEDVNATCQVIQDALEGKPTLAKLEVRVFARGFNPNSVDFESAW